MTDSFAELLKRAFVDVPRKGGKSIRIQRFLLPLLISLWPGGLQGVCPNISVHRMLDMDRIQTRVALNVSFLPTTCDVYTELSNLLLAFFQGGAHLDLTDPGHSATLHSLFAVWIVQKNVAFPLITLDPFLRLCLTGELASGSSLQTTISEYVKALRAELNYMKHEIKIRRPGSAEQIYPWTTMASVWANMPLEDVLQTFAVERRETYLTNFDPTDLVRQWVMQNVPAGNYNPDEIPNRSSHWTANQPHTVFHLPGIVNIIATYLVKPLPKYPVVVFPSARTPKETKYYTKVLFRNTECVFIYSPSDLKAVLSVGGELSLVTVTQHHVKVADYILGKTSGPYLSLLALGVPFGPYNSSNVFGTAGNALRLPADQPDSSNVVIIRPYGQRISLEQVLEWFVDNTVICVCVVVWGDPSDSMPTEDDWQESCHKICTVLPLCDLIRKVEPLQPEGKNVPVLQPNSRICLKVVPTSSTGKIKDPNGPWFLNWREFHIKCTVVYDEDDDKAQKKTSCKRKQPGD